jgi:hypothetical protein
VGTVAAGVELPGKGAGGERVAGKLGGAAVPVEDDGPVRAGRDAGAAAVAAAGIYERRLSWIKLKQSLTAANLAGQALSA